MTFDDSVEMYYGRVREHLEKGGTWAETVRKFPPGAIRTAVKRILERLDQHDIDPEQLDWGTIFEGMRDYGSVEAFTVDLEKSGYIPYNVEAQVDYCAGQMEEYIASMLEEAGQLDPKMLERIASRIKELLGEEDRLSKLRTEVERLRKQSKKEKALKEEYSSKLKEYEGEVGKLRDDVENLRKGAAKAREWKPPEKAVPPKPSAKPKEVEAYEKAMNVNIAAWRREIPPGFRSPMWILTVVDEGTGETIDAVMGSPYTEHDRYKLARITNKKGYLSTILTFREEAERVTTPMPKVEEVKAAIEAVRKEVPGKVMTAPIDWKWMRGIGTRMRTWIDNMQRQVENRASLAVYTYLKSINEWAGEAKARLLAESEPLRTQEERAEVVHKILTDAECEDLWKMFSDALKKADIDPAEYKKDFGELPCWDMTFADNESLIMDKARMTILGKKLAKYMQVVPSPATVKFNWKYIQWGLSSLKVDISIFLDAVGGEDVAQSDSAINGILTTADKMMGLLQQVPEVGAFER